MLYTGEHVVCKWQSPAVVSDMQNLACSMLELEDLEYLRFESGWNSLKVHIRHGRSGADVVGPFVESLKLHGATRVQWKVFKCINDGAWRKK